MALAALKWMPRRAISSTELHRRLAEEGYSRTLRSVQRLLEVLVESGLVERDDRSRPHGYRRTEGQLGLSLAGLGAREALLIALAERHLRLLLPAELRRAFSPFFDEARRLEDLLPPWPHGILARQWLQKVRVVREGLPLLPPVIEGEIVEAVSEALYGNRWLAISYRNAEGRRLEADVMPLGLVQQGVRLYLIARFRGFQEERNLALHRMLSACATDLTFERPADFDLERYEAEGRFGFGAGRHIRIHFSIAPQHGKHLRETPLSEDQVIREQSDHYRVSATVIESAQLDWWLNSFGGDVWNVRRTRKTVPDSAG